MGRLIGNPFLRYPVASLAVTVFLLLFGAARWLGFEVSTETRTLLEGDQRNLATYEKVRDIMSGQVVVVINLHCGPVFTPSGMESIRRISQAFQGQPGLVDVKSFTHSVKPVRRGLSFAMVPLVAPNPDQEELDRLRRYSLENPLIRNVMVSPDEQQTILLNTYHRELIHPDQQARFRQEMEEILAPFRAEGLACDVLGWPLIEDEIRRTLRRDMKRMLPAAGAVLLGILWLSFRSWRTVGVMVVIQATALLLLPALAEVLGCRMNVFTVMLFPLLAAVHLSLLVHLFDAWHHAAQQGIDPDEVIRRTLRNVGKPCGFAALTTALGLLSLQVSEVGLVREFGRLGAAGVGMILGLSFGPGLAWMRWLTPGQIRRSGARSKVPTEFGAANSLQSFCLRYRRWIATGALGTLGLAGVGLAHMRTDVRAVEFLSRQSPTRQVVEQLDAHYGGVNVVQITMDSGQTNGINHRPFLEYLESVQRFAEAQPEVSATYSYAQLLAMMNQIWEEEKAGSFRLPEDPWIIALFTVALKAYPAPFLAALADEPWRKALLIVRTRDMPAQQYLDLLNRILEFARHHSPAGIHVNAAEGIHTILEADRRILRSQANSVGVALLCMGLVLAALWRSVRLAALSLAINLVAVGSILGFAGWSGIALNSVTIMVAAISLGIAVDDSVHFLTHWRERRREGFSMEKALVETLRTKGRPIISSSLVLLGVFLVFLFSSFPPVVHFGLLAAGAISAALVCVLVLLPALLALR